MTFPPDFAVRNRYDDVTLAEDCEARIRQDRNRAEAGIQRCESGRVGRARRAVQGAFRRRRARRQLSRSREDREDREGREEAVRRIGAAPTPAVI